MLRKLCSFTLACALITLPACKKKSAEGDGEEGDKAGVQDSGGDKADGPEASAKAEGAGAAADGDKAELPAPPAAGDKVGASGGSGAGGGSGAAPDPREDLTCDPTEDGACLEGESCVGAQGCDAVWECDAKTSCKKGLREYCGCDGRTFEAVYGNCPWQKYEYPGPCK